MKWLKENLFSTPINSLVTVCLGSGLLYFIWSSFQWLVLDSVWVGDPETCREAQGACLSFLRDKFTFIIFGFYDGSLWRPFLAMFFLIGFLIYGKEPSRWNRSLVYKGLFTLFICGWLLRGGLGLKVVETSLWGGLPLTIVISFFGVLFSYPIGILLALGRRSSMPIIKSFSVIYIELIRGVPLISILFMSSVMLPLFLPEGVTFDKLLRAIVAMILFVSAYMAEVVRGGLSSVPKGQYESSVALGLNTFQMLVFIILPQALKKVIPPTVNTVIGLFKDTSLVLIIALFDLLSTTKTALQDGEWLGFTVEGFLFTAIIYFIFCFSMGNYSRRLEVEFKKSH